MPVLEINARQLSVHSGELLLDALLARGVAVPHSCRAGSCHACLVQCIAGELDDPAPGLLNPQHYAEGWRLACQCRIADDVQLALFDPRHAAIPATVERCTVLAGEVLHIELSPQQGLRFQPGQHVQLYVGGVVRPYSLACLPGTGLLALHIDIGHAGAMSQQLRQLAVGDVVHVGMVHGGALGYRAEWQGQRLLLLASGTGLAPLWSVLLAAEQAQHDEPVQLLFVGDDCYWQAELSALAARWPVFTWVHVPRPQWPQALADMQLVSRRVHALVCGSDHFVQSVSKRLFLAGLPRRQLHCEAFLQPKTPE